MANLWFNQRHKRFREGVDHVLARDALQCKHFPHACHRFCRLKLNWSYSPRGQFFQKPRNLSAGLNLLQCLVSLFLVTRLPNPSGSLQSGSECYSLHLRPLLPVWKGSGQGICDEFDFVIICRFGTIVWVRPCRS